MRSVRVGRGAEKKRLVNGLFGVVGVRVGSRVVSALLQAFFLIFLARTVGPAGFGTYSTFWAGFYLAAILSSVGSNMRALRIRSGDDPDELRKLATARLGVISVIAIGLAILLPVVSYRLPLLLGGTMAAADYLVEYYQSYLAGVGRQLLSSAVVVVARLTPWGAIVAGMATSSQDLVWIVGAVICVAEVVTILALTWVRPIRPHLDGAAVRRATGYWTASSAGSLRQLEPIMVRASGGVALAGGYAIASRLQNPLMILVTALQTVFVPELAGSSDRPDEFSRLRRLSFWVCGGYGVLLVLASPVVAALYLWLLGPEYAFTRPLVISVVGAAGLAAISGAYQIVLYALGRPGEIAVCTVTAAAVGLIGLGLVAHFSPGYLFVIPWLSQGTALVLIAVVGRQAVARIGPAHSSD